MLTPEQRSQSILRASSFEDLMPLVPLFCRQRWTDKLRAFGRNCESLYAARDALRTLRDHEQKKTWPDVCLAISEPKLQISAQFKGSEEARASERSIKDAVKNARLEVLRQAIAAREQEVAGFDAMVELTTAASALQADWVVFMYDYVHTTHGVSVREDVNMADAHGDDTAREASSSTTPLPPVDRPSVIRTETTAENFADLVGTNAESFISTGRQFWFDIPALLTQIRTFSDLRHQRKEDEKERKKSSKKKTEEVLTAAAALGEKGKALLDEAIRERLAVLHPEPAPRTHPHGYKEAVSYLLAHQEFFTEELSVTNSVGPLGTQGKSPFPEKWPRKSFRPSPTEEESPSTRDLSRESTSYLWAGGEEQGQGATRSAEDSETTTSRLRTWRSLRSVSINFFDSDTYPDLLLTLPLIEQILFLLERVPGSYYSFMYTYKNIHRLPGLEMSDTHLKLLSLGSRFLLPRMENRSLPEESFSDFEERVRWNYHMTFRVKNKNLYFNHDYVVPKESRKKAPKGSMAIEDGLAMGRRNLGIQVNRTPVRREKDVLSPLIPGLLEELATRKFLVLPTDKNLGLALITREWFVEKAHDHLYSTSYAEISADEAKYKMSQLSAAVREVGSSKDYWPKELAQISEFICHRLLGDIENTSLETLNKFIPTFYIIPKIHKEPWKGRPIVPCFNAIHGPASKVLNDVLVALQSKRPFVINSTMSLVKRLIKLQTRIRSVKDRSRLWILTGDVTAYYPNIDVNIGIQIAMYYFHLSQDGDIPFAMNDKCMELMLNAFSGNLVMQFGDKYFEQTSGVAMGVPHSPPLANLYGAYFEEESLPEDWSLLYGRYLDDCIAIVEADSRDDALALVNKIQFFKCEIVWEATQTDTAFLDLSISIKDGNLTWKPYGKALNHYERIPWSSAHPKTVKRGTFLGEMTRMAVLSSSYETYVSAVTEVRSIYHSRGYPIGVLDKWTYDMNSRWENRFSEKDLSPGAFVVKSEYNPTWDSINIHSIGEDIRKLWDSHIPSIAPESSRDVRDKNWSSWMSKEFLVSKKRTSSLGDLLNSLRKTLLIDFHNAVSNTVPNHSHDELPFY